MNRELIQSPGYLWQLRLGGIGSGIAALFILYGLIMTLIDAKLTQYTVTDPPPGSATTVTNIDSQGGATDYTDKRGLKTGFTYDAFGRMFIVSFNGSFDVRAGTGSTPDAYDALDRPTNIWMWNGLTLLGGPDFTYDSLDNVLSEKAFGSGGVEFNPVIYHYDDTGRRTSMSPTLNGNALPTINYGYDCADDLVSMSSDGSTLPSCSPSNDVTGGDSSTQIGFFYLEAGLMNAMLSNVVVTFDSFDADGRITTRVYYSYPDGVVYGDLTYQYDGDGRVIDKGGSLTAMNLPPADSASYSTIDQLSTFGGNSTNPDPAGNILNDPLLLLTYTWNARNQLSAMSNGAAETYDSLGRRQGSSSSTANLSLLHDGSSLIASADSVSVNTWSFLPGGLAGSLTSGGVTTTWVPLLDPDGSTIALVNAAQVDSGPTTTITYDPSGVASVTGLSNSFPFLYQGLEHEVTDPGQLDFEPSGNVYNPQIQRELSLTGPQGLNGPPGGGGGGPGNGGFGNFGNPSGSRGQTGNNAGQIYSDISTVYNGFFLFSQPFGSDTSISINPVSLLESLFSDLFGGDSDPPPPPRQLKHGRHPIYDFLGIQQGLTPTEASDSPILMVQATRINPGDDPNLKLKDKELKEKIRELSKRADSLPTGPEKSKLKRQLQQLRQRPSKRAHGADQFNWIPIVPEAPLAADSAALPEAGESLIEVLEFFGFLGAL